MQRVERHVVLNSELFENLTHKSKNLYNYVNYLIRQYFFKTGQLLNEYELSKDLARTKQIDYINMPSAQSAQQTIKLLYKNWKSFFKANKAYKKNSSNFLGRPKLPNYKPTDGHNIIIFTNQNAVIKNGFVHFPKKANITPIKTKVSSLKQVRIIPNATCFIVEIVYEKTPLQLVSNNDNCLSIDLGLNNLVTTFNNIGEKPFIINGKPLKSINQYYNKKKATLMSYIGNRGTSNKINSLTHKRNMKIQDYLHKSSRIVIDYALKHNISTIIVGDNTKWKQNINMGKKNNQNFVSIPHAKLIQQLQYKGEEVGIKIVTTEESYTSKTDNFANEPLKKFQKKDDGIPKPIMGERVSRGMFKSSTKRMVNADVNGALGILRKVVPESRVAILLGNRGVAVTPNKFNTY